MPTALAMNSPVSFSVRVSLRIDPGLFLQKLQDKNPEKHHKRIEVSNVLTLCERLPRKYRAPSDFYFGEIDCVFNVFKDAEIDLTVIRVAEEVREEERKKRDADRKTEQPTYWSPFRNPQGWDEDW